MQHRKLFLAAAGAALAIALTACSGTGAPAGTPAGTASAPQESAVVETQTPAPEAESHTLQATLNSVDTGLDFLVAVDENGNYCRFNLGGVDADGLEPGDSIQQKKLYETEKSPAPYRHRALLYLKLLSFDGDGLLRLYSLCILLRNAQS